MSPPCTAGALRFTLGQQMPGFGVCRRRSRSFLWNGKCNPGEFRHLAESEDLDEPDENFDRL